MMKAVYIVAGVLMALVILQMILLHSDPNYVPTKHTTYIEVWDNGVNNTSRMFIADTVYEKTDRCITFREYPYQNRTTACGDNIVIKTY
jgi:hypothetical protein